MWNWPYICHGDPEWQRAERTGVCVGVFVCLTGSVSWVPPTLHLPGLLLGVAGAAAGLSYLSVLGRRKARQLAAAPDPCIDPGANASGRGTVISVGHGQEKGGSDDC